MSHDYAATRRSWNFATDNHNAHKGDQAAFLRDGGELLFREELELLGELAGKSLVHLQCNSGQDSLCLARRGARVTGVDFSDRAIAFATDLSERSGIAAEFVCAELIEWLRASTQRFDLAFSSYGAVSWLPDIDAWARGIRRVLAPGGRFVYVEFHPLVWSFGADLTLSADDYFERGPYKAPVRDYVADSGAALGAVVPAEARDNPEVATSWQYGLGEIVEALLRAGLVLERLHEYPHANGCRVLPALVPSEARRWVWPPGTARLPLTFGLSAARPS